VPNEPNAVRRLVRKLEREAPGPVRACYEAGPCGYALQRQMTTARVSCQVIAPGVVPRKPGERGRQIAAMPASWWSCCARGLLTEVRPPTLEEEAVRDLCRARDDAREDLQRCRHRLGKLLLRRGLHYSGRKLDAGAPPMESTASRGHSKPSAWWSRTICSASIRSRPRLIELDARLTEIAQSNPYREPVAWLRCFRGIDTLTAILIWPSCTTFAGFSSPRALMAYLGLVPGEDSSGEKHPAAESRAPGTPWCDGSWWKPPGIINTGRRWASRSRAVGKGSRDG